jgi:hypothetical protein
VTLTLTDSQGTGLDVSSTQDVVFGVGGATQFVILDPADGTVDAAITVTVQAQDQFGNLVPTEQRDVTLTASGSATGAGLVDLVDGVGSLALSNTEPETVTLTLTDTQGTGLDVSSTQDVVFDPGVATTLELSGLPDPYPAASSQDVTVTARDQFGNVATGYRGTVHFTSTDAVGGVLLPADYTFEEGDAGARTFAAGVTLITPGAQTVTATDLGDPSITGFQTVTVQ